MQIPTLYAAVALVPLALAAHAGPAERTGEQVVQLQCALCHAAGVGGAPRIGDHAAWKVRGQVGLDNLVRSAIRGRGAMPPSGGLADLSEAELRAAIADMLRRSGVEARD